MDLLSIVRQQESEHRSELSQARWTYCSRTICASLLSLLSVYCAPCSLPSRSGTFFLSVFFVFCSLSAFYFMLRALTALNTNSLLPAPRYASPRATSTLLAVPPYEQLTGKQRFLVVYCFYVVSFLVTIYGVSTWPYFFFVILQLLQLCLYITYSVKLYVLMLP
ncbi:hypothetical protein STCU_10320 [Strigomonas culicis]|uniref:Uncharacterized protein n=1 Tax=Strigomonas culicis TaxID=28005 RepID=S9UTN7_9TRYP|nr:hypothetical protein STCU_10320 [Strigomonas culicis]|eukprot:EPY17916.1 hypothetical protein STCU_10320 [Strigomonas culicis]